VMTGPLFSLVWERDHESTLVVPGQKEAALE